MKKLDEGAALACSLNDADFRERRALARKTLLPKIVSSKRIGNGVTLTFTRTDRLLIELDTFVDLERQCCGFLNFAIAPDVTAPDKLIELSIMGPPEAAKTIEMFFAGIRECE